MKAFFLLLQHRKIAEEKKQAFFKLNNSQKKFLNAYAEQQRSIILNSCNFACKHKKITKILSFWINTKFSFFHWFEFFFFFRLFMVYFAAEAGIVLNLF